MESNTREKLIPYYNGQLDAYSRCCTLISKLGQALIDEKTSQIEAKYLVARTGESIIKLMDNAENLLKEVKKGMM